MTEIDFSWAALSEQLQSPLLFNHPLSRFTSWRVGGRGDVVFIPSRVEDLALVLESCPLAVPITWLGLGSNVLISDEGLRGLVIVTQGSILNHMRIDDHGLYAEAGVPCGQLARFAARNNVQGLEFLAGIPGTVGGALSMNAGCYGGEIWNNVLHVETMNRQGKRQIREKKEFIIRYREVILPDVAYFLSAYFKIIPGNKEDSLLKIKTMLDQRNRAQPTHLPNCGSVFKNPPGNYAAALIEACGLKGYRLGGAQISEKHANFIVNIDHASSRDIVDLIALAKEKVKEKFDIQLQQEVKIL